MAAAMTIRGNFDDYAPFLTEDLATYTARIEVDFPPLFLRFSIGNAEIAPFSVHFDKK